MNVMSSTNKQIDLKVLGMSCNGCANTVENALKQLDGVENVSVDNDDNSASVEYDANKVASDDFQKAVESSGYTFEGIK